MHLDTQHVSWLPAGWSKGLLVDVVICRWRECPGLMAKKTGCYVRPQAPSSLGPIMCEILDQQDHPDLGSLCALVLFSVITGNKIICSTCGMEMVGSSIILIFPQPFITMK